MLLALVYFDKFLLLTRYVCNDVLCFYVGIIWSSKSIRALKKNKYRMCKLLVLLLSVSICHKVYVLSKGIEA